MSGISILLTSPYGHAISTVRNIFVEKVAVVLHIVSQEVGGGSNHKAVSVDGVIETPSCQAENLLVDVEDVEVVVGLVGHHPARHVANSLMWIVDKNLQLYCPYKVTLSSFGKLKTFSAPVAAVRQGCLPSYSPIVTRPGSIF